MRYALISDVHANLPALEAVFEDLARREHDAVFHLGDLVGYAPWPNETVELLRTRQVAGVAGNYDSTVATDHRHCGCRYEDPRQEELSHLSYGWTRLHVAPDTKRFLAGLPFRIDLRPGGGHTSRPTVILVHGAPRSTPSTGRRTDRTPSVSRWRSGPGPRGGTCSPSGTRTSPGTA